MTPTQLRQRPDIATIADALHTLVAPGDVIELRIPKVDGKRRTDSGYFNDLDKAARAAAFYDGRASGVYVTLNPAIPALLSRAQNRVQEWTDLATTDDYIARRVWLPIDIDPRVDGKKRPAGISSSDAEHTAALDRAAAIAEWLSLQSWPEPVVADSGNGAALLYPIELPNDQTSTTLIQRCLEALATAFDDHACDVDTAVFNAARIWKVYGTLAGKGDSTVDRPHRRSAIVSAPAALTPVPVELLRALARRVLPEPERETQAASKNGIPDVGAYLEAHGISIATEKTRGDRTIYVLEECPFNADHRAPDACVTREASGKLGFHCFHSSCQGNTWKTLRAQLEPSIYDERPPVERSNGVVSKTTQRPARPYVPTAIEQPVDLPTLPESDEQPPAPGPAVEVPPLPAAAQLDPALSAGGCPWLDDYVAFSQRWAPRAYSGFHRAVGLWLLSTVAARRVRLSMGGERFPSLYISLCARTSLFTKSTVAKVAIETLRAAGLSHLLAADDATPQAFIRAMTRKVPADYNERDAASKARVVQRLAFAAQRGWWYEEFGQKVAAMMKDGGFMADFRGILRRFDDCPAKFEYSSILRGDDVVEQPYLSLLTNLTPADLKPYAGKNAALWGDGFWARFAFVTPPPDADRPRGRWPVGAMRIPAELANPLRRWHEDLGIPAVEVDEKTDKNDVVVHVDVHVDDLPVTDCLLGPGVFDAFYTYLDALLDLAAEMPSQDFDGNYARLPEKALRVAMLAASLENDNRIELRHWALGQEVAEQWRAELHNLAASLQGDVQESRTSDVEQRIQATIKRLGRATVNDLRRHVRGLSVEEIERSCEALVRIGVVLSEQTTKGTKRYTPAAQAIVDIVDSRHRRHNPQTSTIAPDEGSGDTPDRVPPDNRRHFLDASTVYPVYDVYDSSDIQENVSLEQIEDGVYIEETDQGYEVVDYINSQRFLVSAHADADAAQAASTEYLTAKERKARYSVPEGY